MAKLTEEKLRDIIRELIKELLKEVSQTGDVAGYDTPYAFTGQMDSEKRKKWQKKKVKDTGTGWETIGDADKPDKINEAVSKEAEPENKIVEGRYRDFKEDASLTPKQKLGYSLRMIRDNLCEIDEMIDINLRLKTEAELNAGDYWKQSHRALTRIEEKMTRIINKIKKFY